MNLKAINKISKTNNIRPQKRYPKPGRRGSLLITAQQNTGVGFVSRGVAKTVYGKYGPPRATFIPRVHFDKSNQFKMIDKEKAEFLNDNKAVPGTRRVYGSIGGVNYYKNKLRRITNGS